jgi:hypothetical protein
MPSRKDYPAYQFGQARLAFVQLVGWPHALILFAAVGIYLLMQQNKSPDSRTAFALVCVGAAAIDCLICVARMRHLELSSGVQAATVVICLVAALLPPPLLYSLSNGNYFGLALIACAFFPICFLLWFYGTLPHMRSEVEKALSEATENQSEYRQLLDGLNGRPADRSAPPAQAPHADALADARRRRDGRIAEVIAASQDPDNPLPPQAVVAQLQQINEEYEREAQR